MSEAIANLKVALFYYKIIIWKVYYGMLSTAILALPATIMNWYVMNTVEKIIAVSGVILAVHKWVDGFMDQTIGRILSGRPPIDFQTDENNRPIV